MNRPTLIMLVGIPGAGKTTYAKKYVAEHDNAMYLSSDLIRQELWGDEAIQGDNNKVFSLMHDMTITALNHGKNVVYDATNITRKDRAFIISKCPKFAKIEAHIVWAPIETCIERDAARERTVGKDVIDRMLKRFHAPYYDDGIDEIKVILPNDFDRHVYEDWLLQECDIPHDNPHHTLNIKDHCNAAANYLQTTYGPYVYASKDVNVYLAALYHDIGKPYTKGFVDTKGNPCDTANYYQHHNVGAYMFYGILQQEPEIAWLIGNHMEPFFDSKYYKNLPPYLKEKIDKLHEADMAAH